jgi:hypothetical protein
VGVFVGVGVGVNVPVGVGVDMVMLNANVQAETAACGCASGTVGATCLVWESFPLVKMTITANPMVSNVTTTKYQCFFK